MASLILNKSETEMIESYLKQTAQNLQKLMDKTPASVVAFLGGTLPGTALLHLKQFSIFGMISRAKNSVLYNHGMHVLTSARSSSSSWFQQIRGLCILYQLPHPVSFLQEPPKPETFKRLVKSRIVDHWEVQLRAKAASLTSAPYFKPSFMSLCKPHPIWSSCGPNPWECNKAVTSCRMLSGKYLTDQLQRHWTLNTSGDCLLPACSPRSLGSLEHLLLHCSALRNTREKMIRLSYKVSTESSELANIIITTLNSGDQKGLMQLLLDCTAVPGVIRCTQQSGSQTCDRLLYLGRTWCHSIHRERMTQLGLFRFR